MSCSEENKTTLGTYALREEAIVWWRNVRLRIGVDGVAIVWETFKREFLRKYFPADVKNKKVIEFMELKQGNLSVAEYSAKFEALCVFSPHYNTVEAEEDKCVKFESGLRPDIKLLIGFSEIRDFPTLMTKARIFWLYPKLRKSFRYFDYCRVDFPYSANKTEDPRSQDRTDKTEVAELIRLERSFSSLVEELTGKENLHSLQRDLQSLMKLEDRQEVLKTSSSECCNL
ncbi:unnamed protein product [Trifolium pratense]|uniref:Uncharacterized protein n=1 Tax=Trifolium pratense TaxID=57577 RepID=A0ACB0K9A1_TRIPR|nr:unnamed protein product [Trifolium pratense]